MDRDHSQWSETDVIRSGCEFERSKITRGNCRKHEISPHGYHRLRPWLYRHQFGPACALDLDPIDTKSPLPPCSVPDSSTTQCGAPRMAPIVAPMDCLIVSAAKRDGDWLDYDAKPSLDRANRASTLAYSLLSCETNEVSPHAQFAPEGTYGLNSASAIATSIFSWPLRITRIA